VKPGARCSWRAGHLARGAGERRDDLELHVGCYAQSKKGSFAKDFPHQTYPEMLAAELSPHLDQAIAEGRARVEQAAARYPRQLVAENLASIATPDAFHTLSGAALWTPREA